MLDGSNINDIVEMSKYGKALGFLIAKRYKLPTYSNYYILENEEEIRKLLDKFPNQNDFCMRSDLKGNTAIGIGGQNGNRETVFRYMNKIKEKSEQGVLILYWNEGKFCPTYETEGCFYVDFQTKKQLMIDYVGKGWDGSFLSHGTACHESYVVPWNDILFLNDNNINKYKINVINENNYNNLRNARIKDLQEKYGMSKEKSEEVIPVKYTGINKEYIRQVIEQIIIPLYNCLDLQRNYKEYISAAQIENGKVLVIEVILPSRLNYKNEKNQDEER